MIICTAVHVHLVTSMRVGRPDERPGDGWVDEKKKMTERLRWGSNPESLVS